MLIVIVDLENNYGLLEDFGYECSEVEAICSAMKLNICSFSDVDCSVNPIVFGDTGVFIVDVDVDAISKPGGDGVSALVSMIVYVDGFSCVRDVIEYGC